MQLPLTLYSVKDEDTLRRKVLPLVTSSSPRRICAICGGKTSKRATICWECYTKRRKATIQIPCARCGEIVKLSQYEYDKKLRRDQRNVFCSKTCANLYRGDQNLRKCAYCGNQTIRAHTRTKYCSKECRDAARLAARPRKDCPQCGAEFIPKSNRTVYCSRDCANAAHSERMRGRGNSHFKDGTSYALWFSEMRPLILERDGFRCVNCNRKQKDKHFVWRGREHTKSNLAIHHIDEDVANNRAENLVTLCQKCHHRHHNSERYQLQWLGEYAQRASESMILEWKEHTISLLARFSSIIAES